MIVYFFCVIRKRTTSRLNPGRVLVRSKIDLSLGRLSTMRNEATVEIERLIDDVFRLTSSHVAERSIIFVEDGVVDQKGGRSRSQNKSVIVHQQIPRRFTIIPLTIVGV